MDPLTMVVAAISAGAAAGLQDTVTQALTDAYAGLKRLLTGRYPNANPALAQLENKPDSQTKRDSLEEDLADAGAGGDTDLISAARKLIDVVEAQAGDVGPAIGVDLKRVQAAALRLGTVESTGTGVKLEDGRFTGDITIENVRAGMGDRSQDPPPAR